MTSRERVLAVFAGDIPDRVPAWLGASPEWKALAKARAGLKTDEALALFVGDDFRRVHAKYAGPPECSPDRAFVHPEATARTPFGVERTGYGYGQPVEHPLGPRPDRRRHRTLSLARSRAGWTSRESATKPCPGAAGSPSSAATGRRSITTPSISWAWKPSWSCSSRTRPSSTILLRHLVDYYFQHQPAHLRGRGRRHRYLLHRQRLRDAERARSSARPSSAASSSPTSPAWPRWVTTSASRSCSIAAAASSRSSRP